MGTADSSGAGSGGSNEKSGGGGGDYTYTAPPSYRAPSTAAVSDGFKQIERSAKALQAKAEAVKEKWENDNPGHVYANRMYEDLSTPKPTSGGITQTPPGLIGEGAYGSTPSGSSGAMGQSGPEGDFTSDRAKAVDPATRGFDAIRGNLS